MKPTTATTCATGEGGDGGNHCGALPVHHPTEYLAVPDEVRWHVPVRGRNISEIPLGLCVLCFFEKKHTQRAAYCEQTGGPLGSGVWVSSRL